MIYEAEKGDLSLALTGETLIVRRLSVHREPKFLEMIEILRNADVSFTNLEALIQDWSDTPNTFAGGGAPGGTYMAAPPECADDLKWAGFNLLSTANNHASDFGEAGYVTNLKFLKKAGLAQAGMGMNLTEATAPAYLDTARGRVAMIAACDWGPRGAGDMPWPFPMGVLAGEQSPYSKGRPGVNLIRHRVEITVPKESFDALRKLSEGMGWTKARDSRRKLSVGWDKPATGARMSEATDSDDIFHFMGTTFVLGDKYKLITVAEPDDVARNLKWVRDARRMADWVIMSYHNHASTPHPLEPPVHSAIYARQAIDAGADMYVGHGTGHDRGIEFYNGKPIFHGLGVFMHQNEQVPWVPYENMARFGLGFENTPADFYETRSGHGTKGHVTQVEQWESAVVQVEYKDRRVSRIRLRPIDLGMKLPSYQHGRPVLADEGGEVYQRVIVRFREASSRYGTEISPDGEVVIK